jgi:hypothetical protein
MSDGLARLISIGGGALVAAPTTPGNVCAEIAGPLLQELVTLLRWKNGFYAFESALHVFPAGRSGTEIDLDRWNSGDLWRSAYDDLADGCLFFAEDVFGGQFCVCGSEVCTFDPETGDRQRIATSFEEWAPAVLSDYELLTGYPFARDWQVAHGPLPSGKRLVPKQPFVLQGEYALSNLQLMDAVKGMQLRGELAVQIRDLPDGAQVRYEVVD